MGTTGNTFHPWRRLRALTDWKLKWEEMPLEMYGHTNFRTKTITLALGMNQAERRCTITHEVEHVLRGPVDPHQQMHEELMVDRAASRLLLPSMKEVVDALAWARGEYEEASHELWVDPLMLEVRLSALRARERDYVNRRMAEVLL